jgi:hypothetical protein
VATVNIVWNWGTNSNIAFNPATDILDFGWFAADQFTISEVNGTVVIAIPSNHQTYALAHTTLSELHLSNIVAKDTSAIAAWQSALASAPVAPPPPPAPPPPAAPPTSGATTWSASSIYTAGMTATENGVTYKANRYNSPAASRESREIWPSRTGPLPVDRPGEALGKPTARFGAVAARVPPVAPGPEKRANGLPSVGYRDDGAWEVVFKIGPAAFI